uniref:Uncharacterized protein n=1 Tax=Romanomermis culicivorax TaxID=13658 RepID=A0A915JRH7_ROMCU
MPFFNYYVCNVDASNNHQLVITPGLFALHLVHFLWYDSGVCEYLIKKCMKCDSIAKQILQLTVFCLNEHPSDCEKGDHFSKAAAIIL